MRAISETISTVIITSVITLVSITIFYIAIISLSTSMHASEYGYMKSSLVNIASSIPEIAKGTSISISVPRGSVGVGYRVENNIVYEVDILTASGWRNITVDNETSAIEIRTTNIAVSTNRLIFGVNNLTVNDLAYIPTIWEYYDDGASVLNFNTSRFYLHTYIVTNGTLMQAYISVYYVQLRPKYVSGPRTLMFIPGGRIIDVQYSEVLDLVIREIDVTTGRILRSYRPTDAFTLGCTVNVLLRIDRLYVVMT